MTLLRVTRASTGTCEDEVPTFVGWRSPWCSEYCLWDCSRSRNEREKNWKVSLFHFFSFHKIHFLTFEQRPVHELAGVQTRRIQNWAERGKETWYLFISRIGCLFWNSWVVPKMRQPKLAILSSHCGENFRLNAKLKARLPWSVTRGFRLRSDYAFPLYFWKALLHCVKLELPLVIISSK